MLKMIDNDKELFEFSFTAKEDQLFENHTASNNSCIQRKGTNPLIPLVFLVETVISKAIHAVIFVDL